MSKDNSLVRYEYYFLEKLMKLDRRKKIESTAQKYISEFIIEDQKELFEGYGIITVTWVKLASELSYIDIYVSSLKNSENLCSELAKSANDIHRLLAKHIDFLKVPKVRFRYDGSWKDSTQIIEILHSLE